MVDSFTCSAKIKIRFFFFRSLTHTYSTHIYLPRLTHCPMYTVLGLNNTKCIYCPMSDRKTHSTINLVLTNGLHDIFQSVAVDQFASIFHDVLVLSKSSLLIKKITGCHLLSNISCHYCHYCQAVSHRCEG
jgi:hypothetical protein